VYWGVPCLGQVDLVTEGNGAGGSDGMLGTAGAPATMHMDLGSGEGKDLITIGDAWMNLIVTGIEPSLDAVVKKTYRHSRCRARSC
jgi:hypothetical protein